MFWEKEPKKVEENEKKESEKKESEFTHELIFDFPDGSMCYGIKGEKLDIKEFTKQLESMFERKVIYTAGIVGEEYSMIDISKVERIRIIKK